MEPTTRPDSSVHINGGVTGQNVVIGSTQTVHGDLSIQVGTLPAWPPDARATLQQLVAQLTEALSQVPPERRDDVQDVRLATEDAVAEADNEQPDVERLERRSSALKRAAERLADIAPAVLSLATQVAAAIATFH